MIQWSSFGRPFVAPPACAGVAPQSVRIFRPSAFRSLGWFCVSRFAFRVFSEVTMSDDGLFEELPEARKPETGASSAEHTSELQSLIHTEYDVFCCKKHKKQK